MQFDAGPGRKSTAFHTIRQTPKKIRQRLHLIEPLVYRHRQPLSCFKYLKLSNPMDDPPASLKVDNGNWQTIPWGSYWCEFNADFVLRAQFQTPPGWSAGIPTALYLPIGKAGDFSHPEALAYIDGAPYAACDRHHQEIILPPRYCDTAPHLLALHGWAGSLGNDPDAQLLMRECALVQIDQLTRDYATLARVALGVADCLDENVPARAHLYTALDEAFQALDTREPFGDRFYASVPPAHEILLKGVAQSGAPLDVCITAAGHAHIDVAWLWTLGQTRRKAGRTFHNVIRLMEQFPGFHFSQSQPQLYDFVRQDYPDLFESIKQRVLEGRWEVLGGAWVEMDCNISGAESLARQFLLGREFFRRHFGAEAESPVLWLPDVFGYAWSLPQLIKEARLEYFFTIKLGWNQYNRLPYDSFWWQGLDGTRVLTHFSPTPGGGDYASTYNAAAMPEQVLGTWRNFQQKDAGQPGATPPLLMAFGYGDGGGGPTREMVENIRAMGEFPATPRINCGTVGGFFRKLEAEVGGRLPTWNGELYLENHRGTYTTQSRNKRANRKSEFLLHDTEFLAALAAETTTYQYPHAELHRAWELVCLNQFHDIIPGSSIGAVYVESQQQYAEVREIGERVRDGALAAIAGQVGGDLLLVNPTSFTRRDLAFWVGGEVTGLQHADGSPVPIQSMEGGLLLDAGELPPYSVTPLFNDQLTMTNDQLDATPTLLENDFLRVELNEAGDVTRIYDKRAGHEALPPGAIANQFQAFEDRPINPDAWDVDIFFDDKLWLAEPADSVRVAESGPLRATLEIKRRILNSEYIQRISLAHNSPRLDFDTIIQWRERHVLLKVAFPVDVLSPTATHEIQWGNVQRPTHRNTSWDWARFETCAQKWVDLSEGGYGVSLLNDCKYGHDILDNVIRLSLLRGPTEPDPEADLGEHQFAYSLLPHSGGWDELTIANAYALNDPLIVWAGEGSGGARGQRGRGAGEQFTFVAVNQPNIVVETIKQAEDGRGLILRLYESQRRRGHVTLTTGFPLAKAWRTNLLEENQEPLPCDDHCVNFFIKPYQIMTMRIVRRGM
ncbi:MAG: alpha-mannosidase [Chloroflexi bacterium]|nr:MAG: alpha-mannosidase [Chloroflexota bacterium]RLC87205.1 MAG: alpha-mannosidase [Chloroflexota bacterium]